jgi:hypothetical protein
MIYFIGHSSFYTSLKRSFSNRSSKNPIARGAMWL